MSSSSSRIGLLQMLCLRMFVGTEHLWCALVLLFLGMELRRTSRNAFTAVVCEALGVMGVKYWLPNSDPYPLLQMLEFLLSRTCLRCITAGSLATKSSQSSQCFVMTESLDRRCKSILWQAQLQLLMSSKPWRIASALKWQTPLRLLRREGVVETWLSQGWERISSTVILLVQHGSSILDMRCLAAADSEGETGKS